MRYSLVYSEINSVNSAGIKLVWPVDAAISRHLQQASTKLAMLPCRRLCTYQMLYRQLFYVSHSFWQPRSPWTLSCSVKNVTKNDQQEDQNKYSTSLFIWVGGLHPVYLRLRSCTLCSGHSSPSFTRKHLFSIRCALSFYLNSQTNSLTYCTARTCVFYLSPISSAVFKLLTATNANSRAANK